MATCPGGSFRGIAYGVSADGSVVVGYGISASGYEAFIWDNTNGMRSLKDVLVNLGLDLTGWTLLNATDISGDGLTIVGYGYSSGGGQAWRVQLDAGETIPEPSTIALLGIGLAGLTGGGYVRRRRKKIAD